MESVGVIGLGFVGTAVFEGMRHVFAVHGFDKAFGWRESRDRTERSGKTYDRAGFMWDGLAAPWIAAIVERVDGPIFLCLPTPMRADGSCDCSIVESVARELDGEAGRRGKCVAVAIKSTVPPGTTERLARECRNLLICVNPEFLRETSSVTDFRNQDRVVLGGSEEARIALRDAYTIAFPGVPIVETDSTMAEMAKYLTNAFLAVKVSFANEMSRICEALGVDYGGVVECAARDSRLGDSHWDVPGPDGHHGFGGSCFPKDVNALLDLAGRLGTPTFTLAGAWRTNLAVRPERDWERLIGRAVV